jgi:hypothetical protein
MIMSPGAIGILRFVLLNFEEQDSSEPLTTNTSYRHHNINDPAFFIGISIPSDE